MRDYYDERKAKIERWFSDHEATPEREADGLVSLDWRKRDGSSFYFTRYVLDRYDGVLTAYGDLGDAIYRWGAWGREGGYSFEWIAGLSLDYFASKCCASEEGRKYVDFDADVLRRSIEEAAGDALADGAAFDPALVAEALDNAWGRDTWHRWLEDEGHRLFGSEWYDGPPEWGDVTAMRCQAHLVGLQMAVAQLAVPDEVLP